MLTVLALLVAPWGGQRALTPLDALHVLPWTPGRVAHYGDWNDDGVPDVAMERQPPEGLSIEVLRAIDGHVLAALWKGRRLVDYGAELPWDLGDVDGDGVPDLILGMPNDATAGEGAGAVQVVSGATAQTLAVTYGERAGERYGSSIAYLSDVNDDGRGDYAIGSASSGVDSPGSVCVRSGGNQCVVWRTVGRGPGRRFGSAIARMGDLDGDCLPDLLVRRAPGAVYPALALSGQSGRPLFEIAHRLNPSGNAGDFDGDGMDDIFLDTCLNDCSVRGTHAVVVSGRTRLELCKVDYPDWAGSFGMTVGVGDLDGDGFDELALGEPDFNLPDERGGRTPMELAALRRMSLDQALAIESRPTSMTSESGALRVVSGRTRQPIWGIWGRPGTRDSIGFHACSIPDVSGDGAPDLVVTGNAGTFVFEGPGPVRW